MTGLFMIIAGTVTMFRAVALWNEGGRFHEATAMTVVGLLLLTVGAFV